MLVTLLILTLFITQTCLALPVAERGGLEVIPADETRSGYKERIVPNIIKGEPYWYWFAIQSSDVHPEEESQIYFIWVNGTQYLGKLRMFAKSDLSECKKENQNPKKTEQQIIEDCKRKISKDIERDEIVTIPPYTFSDDLQFEMETTIPQTEKGNDFLIVFKIVDKVETPTGGNAPLNPPKHVIGYRMIITETNWNKYFLGGGIIVIGIGGIITSIAVFGKKKFKKKDKETKETAQEILDSDK